MAGSSKARQREALSRDRVLAAAMAHADEHGIEALSMRKLAASLGVEAMSLYHHVANKDDLLDGMVDLVFAELELPDGDDWRASLAGRCRSLRAALLRHPWALGVLESRTSPGMANLLHHDAVLGCLRSAGFSVAGAAHAYALVDSYVYGFVLQELTLPFDPGDSVAELAGDLLESMPTDLLPNLAAMVTEHVLVEGYAFSDEFENGLGVVLDGLDRWRDGA